MQIIQKKLQLSLSACSQICLGSNLHDSASNITITKIIYKNNCALADQSLICQRTLSNVDRCKNNVIYMSSMVQWWKHLKSKLMIWVHTGKVAICVLISARFAKFEFISARFAKFWVLISKICQIPLFGWRPESLYGKCANPCLFWMNSTWVSKSCWETKSEPEEFGSPSGSSSISPTGGL